MPRLIVLAGANGSGKSSLHQSLCKTDANILKIPFINPDNIAKELFGHFLQNNSPEENIKMMKSGREAIKRRKRYLDSGSDFAFETTLSGKSELKIIEEAYKKKYIVEMYFVGLNHPFLNVSRVKERVLKGGHDIASDVIIRRYGKSFENMEFLIKKGYLHILNVYDNSETIYRLISMNIIKKRIEYFPNEEVVISSQMDSLLKLIKNI